jgi:uncharacterized membrane protein YdjX (TVP38/TMEM64 family)
MPNWLVNMASPIVGVPLHQFFFATLIGLIPANYLHVSTGQAINNLQTGESLMSWHQILALSCFGVVALLPTWLNKKPTTSERKVVANDE